MGLNIVPTNYRRVLILTAAVGLALASLFGIAIAMAKTPGTPIVQEDNRALVKDLIVRQDGLSFSLISPRASIVEGELSVTGLEARIQKTGHPGLPYYSTLVVLPPGAEVSARLHQGDESINAGIEVAPVTGKSISSVYGDMILLETSLEDDRVEDLVDMLVYDTSQFYPYQSFELSDPFYYRNLRLVKLSLYPYRFNPIAKELIHTGRFDVELSYSKVHSASNEVTPAGENSLPTIGRSILNQSQANLWRSLPKKPEQTAVRLPIGIPAFKIEVDSDGIYEVSHSDLVASGMPSATVDSSSLQLIHLGSPVAMALDDGDDGTFGYGDKFRFYGWGFSDQRSKRQYTDRNVFWLLTSGTISESLQFDSVDGPLQQSYLSSTTYEEDAIWFSGYTDEWELFPNEPDAWYADAITSHGDPVTKTFTITLPNPVQSSAAATYTVELGSFDDQYLDYLHTVSVSLPGSPYSSTRSWFGERNVNITGTVPISYLNDGPNHFEVEVATDGPYLYIALNRITVDYERYTKAADNQLHIVDNGSGPRSYNVSEIQTSFPSQLQIWDVSDRIQPEIINPDSYTVTDGGSSHAVTFGLDGPSPRTLIVSAVEKIQTPLAVTQYTAPNLNPPSGGAEWVAISYGAFITEVNRLAEFRADPTYSGLSVHVVDVEDVLNQFGFGLPMPDAINSFISYTLYAWSPAPQYLTLVGDSTIDPRHVRNDWYKEQYVPTYMEFVDRYQGQVPADLGFSLLTGDDLFPDLAVGRLPVSTDNEASAIINKIITYEVNLRTAFGWMENLVFLADDPDAGGNFCYENQAVQLAIPSSMNLVDLCLNQNPSREDTIAMRDQLFTNTNEVGTLILNYRGHGSYNTWAGFPEPLLYLNWGHSALWNNPNKPVVIITGDCWDGNFALPFDYDGIGEVFLRQEGSGSVAHWGSSGLGKADEHTLLTTYFYEGLFSAGQTTFGDAMNYAKTMFLMAGGHPSVPYTFSLLGDPAMNLMRPSLSLEASTEKAVLGPTDSAVIGIELTNHGLYPSVVTVSSTLPAGFSFLGVESSVDVQTQLVGNQVIFDLQYGEEAPDEGIPRNAGALITFRARLSSSVESGYTNIPVEVTAPGLEAWPGDESDKVSFLVLANKMNLPFVRKP